MKSKFPRTLLSGSWSTLVVPALLGLSIGTGCAHQQTNKQPDQLKAQQQTIAQLQSRLEEVERTNGRLNVRIEDLEDQLFLLQDMTESNRIALRRRGYMKRQGTYIGGGQAQARAPQPTPESYYGDDSPYGAQQQAPAYEEPRPHRRKVTRIQLSRQQAGGYEADAAQQPAGQQAQPQPSHNQPSHNQPSQPQQAQSQADSAPEQGDDEIVITEDKYREYFGQPAAKESSHASSKSGSKKSSSHKAQAPVTDEKLATSKGEAPSTNDKASAKHTGRPLEIYKTALSDYRGGNYAEALSGFRAFLNAGPNPNYLDNALYWIGECHYGLGEYDQATKFFHRVLREQPDGNKVPDAMLKMSLAYERLGQPDQTRALLEKLTDRYPTTNAGRLGAQKLSELQN